MNLNDHCPVGIEEESARMEALLQQISSRARDGRGVDDVQCEPSDTRPIDSETLSRTVDAARGFC